MVACRNVGDEMMIRTVHSNRAAVRSPGAAFFVFRYICQVRPAQRLEMVEFVGLASQFAGGGIDGVVDQRQAYRFLGREVTTERAR